MIDFKVEPLRNIAMAANFFRATLLSQRGTCCRVISSISCTNHHQVGVRRFWGTPHVDKHHVE